MKNCQVCIVGAGPAGMLLALLMARKGISVKLLELHADLERDFRGDTVHASTLEVLDQIGMAGTILALPHNKMRGISINTPEASINLFSFERLKTRFPYIALMPQASFLKVLLASAQTFPNFESIFSAGVSELIESDGKVLGVRAKHGDETLEISADVVIACDGRFSKVRKLASLDAPDLSPTMDVAWLRLPRQPEDPEEGGAFYISGGHLCVLLQRETQWQIGYVMLKGDFGQVREKGIETFRAKITETVPWLSGRVQSIAGFEDLHLLAVKSDRLAQWCKPGLLLIGDAAHAMSPVGGVGINYAVADAVETANQLIPRLLGTGEVDIAALETIQRVREKPTAAMQRVQTMIQNNIVTVALDNGQFQIPWWIKVLTKTPFLRDIPPRVIALGFNKVSLTPEAR